MSDAPLVSVVTPVYNGAEFLPQCIESVLAQTYQNWDFTIVNNCSTDDSLGICQKYTAIDRRIRVVTNPSFLKIIENHNRTLRYLSSEAKYCKVVFADDWLFPTCIEELVANAERHPSVGIVSSYALAGDRILCAGLPFPSYVVDGREVCRRKLAGGLDVFGTPTAQLYRADLVRRRSRFFNEENLHADTEACLDVLQDSDFGFIHQVLSYSRPRPQSNDALANSFETRSLGGLMVFLKYGPIYMNRDEYTSYLKNRLREYHRVLAKNVLRCRSTAFWRFHKEKLSALGLKLDRSLLAASVVRELIRMLLRPASSATEMKGWWREAVSRLFHPRSSEVRLP
jgi:glycosyltransferase involved in cell wall biosynthesis